MNKTRRNKILKRTRKVGGSWFSRFSGSSRVSPNTQTSTPSRRVRGLCSSSRINVLNQPEGVLDENENRRCRQTVRAVQYLRSNLGDNFDTLTTDERELILDAAASARNTARANAVARRDADTASRRASEREWWNEYMKQRQKEVSLKKRKLLVEMLHASGRRRVQWRINEDARLELAQIQNYKDMNAHNIGLHSHAYGP